MELTLNITTEMTDSEILSEVRKARKMEGEGQLQFVPVMVQVAVPQGTVADSSIEYPKNWNGMTPEEQVAWKNNYNITHAPKAPKVAKKVVVEKKKKVVAKPKVAKKTGDVWEE